MITIKPKPNQGSLGNRSFYIAPIQSNRISPTPANISFRYLGLNNYGIS